MAKRPKKWMNYRKKIRKEKTKINKKKFFDTIN